MQIQNSLEQLGLSIREARVYKALLNIGPTTITRLVKDTSIPSSKIYDVLERLIQKGLVTHILVKGKKEFHPASPDKLFSLLKEKEKLINNILPDLNKLYEKTSEEVQAEIFKGPEGLKAVLDDIVKTKKDFINLGASGKGELILPYFVPQFYERLKEKKINFRMLAVDTELTKKQFSKLKKYKNIKIKYLPKTIHNFMSTLIYGGKVALVPITPAIESLPITILIKSKESADSYREIFEWIWKSIK